VDDVQLRVKLLSLFTKIGKRTRPDDWINLLHEPHQLKSAGRNYALMHEEYVIRLAQVS